MKHVYVVQLVEHLPHKQAAAGSSPAIGTKLIRTSENRAKKARRGYNNLMKKPNY